MAAVSEGAKTPTVLQQEGRLATMAGVAAQVCWEALGQAVAVVLAEGVVVYEQSALAAEDPWYSRCCVLVVADARLA